MNTPRFIQLNEEHLFQRNQDSAGRAAAICRVVNAILYLPPSIEEPDIAGDSRRRKEVVFVSSQSID
jgi:hypothetical protein